MRHLLLAIICTCCWAATAPGDPPWALDTTADTGKGEAQVSAKIVQDAYGYYTTMNVGGTWDNAAGAWDGGRTLKLRYIPNHGSSVSMDQGVPPGGLFPRGAFPGEWGAKAAEEPFDIGKQDSPVFSGGHSALLVATIEANGFWMPVTEINQETWNAVPGAPGVSPQFVHGLNPVERVTYSQVDTWITALKDQYDAALASGHEPLRGGEQFSPRLPNENEWEYACRAGTFSPYFAGPTLRPLNWEAVRHDESTNGHDYNGRSPSWPNDMILRRWRDEDTGVSTTDQSKYLSAILKNPGRWSYQVSDTKTASDPGFLVSEVTVNVSVEIFIRDYFMLVPDETIEANYDSRYRRHWIERWPGTHVPLRERWRGFPNATSPDYFIRDPSVSDSQVWFRYQASNSYIDSDGDGSPDEINPTPPGDFVKYAGNEHNFYRWSSHHTADPDGVYYHDGTSFHRVHCRDWQPIDGQRYRALTDNPDREQPSHFEPDDDGMWVRSTVVNGAGGTLLRERFHHLDAALAQATFDKAGSFWGQTMPHSDSPLDEPDAEQLLLEVSIGNGIFSIAGKTVTVSPGAISTCGEDIAKMRQALANEWQDVVWSGNDHWFHNTKFRVNLQASFNWNGVRAKVEDDGYGDWAGFDVRSMNPDQIIPNPWGLKHMHGNVAEWTSTPWDGLSGHHNHRAAPAGGYKPRLTPWPDHYVVKGGTWRFGIDQVRSAARQARQGDGQSMDLVNKANPPTMRPGYDDVGFRFIIPAYSN